MRESKGVLHCVPIGFKFLNAGVGFLHPTHTPQQPTHGLPLPVALGVGAPAVVLHPPKSPYAAAGATRRPHVCKGCRKGGPAAALTRCDLGGVGTGPGCSPGPACTRRPRCDTLHVAHPQALSHQVCHREPYTGQVGVVQHLPVQNVVCQYHRDGHPHHLLDSQCVPVSGVPHCHAHPHAHVSAH